MREFAKLYATILDSSVWGESKDVKLLWVTMLIMGAEKGGHVEASVGGLARRAGLTREECEIALAKLSEPDEDDRSGVNEGRRIEKVEGGWQITNHKTYRDFRTDAQVHNAERQQRFRDNHPKPKKKSHGALRNVTSVTQPGVTPSHAPSRTDLELERDQERKPEIARAREEAPPPPVLVERKPEHPRNPAEALDMPIAERAAYVELNPHNAQWLTPEAWPEVLAVALAVHEGSGGRGELRLLPHHRDSGVRNVVALFAAGFTQDELLEAVRSVTKSPWWRADGGKPRSLGALSAEVVRRALASAREQRLTPEQQARVDRAKQGLGPEPRRAAGTPSLLAASLPALAASGGDS